ncbi:MAG: DUF975 family protein [Bacteroidales bacterium]|nr:DUF975 family protein [Bacteroidales bacterium]
MTNQDYKNAALAALKGNWAPAVLATIVFMLIAIVISGGSALFPESNTAALFAANGLTSILSLLVLVPLEVGFYYAFVKLLKEGDANILSNSVSLGFSGWIHKVLTMLLLGIVVMCGVILFIIPGIILSFAYSMVPYLLVKHPELSILETLKTSRMMMKGHKFDYFFLSLSFIGWIILGIFTLFIGYFWLIPYIQTTFGAFWDDVYSQAKPATEE